MAGWKLYFDGACSPKNPGGVSTYGWVLYRPDGTFHSEDCGVTADGTRGEHSTCNIAEFAGIEAGVLAAVGAGVEILECYGDSKLVVKTVGGSWRCRKPHLIVCCARVREHLSLLDRWQTFWIPREQNGVADALSKQAYVEFLLSR